MSAHTHTPLTIPTVYMLCGHHTWKKAEAMTLMSPVKPLPHKRENKGEVLLIVGTNTKSKVQVRLLCILSLPVTMLCTVLRPPSI